MISSDGTTITITSIPRTSQAWWPVGSVLNLTRFAEIRIRDKRAINVSDGGGMRIFKVDAQS